MARRANATGPAAASLVLEAGPPAAGGACVARHEGQVVFVRHALPGETVRARVTERRAGYLRADAVEVLDASPDRVEPPCPYARPGRCGGCDLQHAAPAAQRSWKARIVEEQLRRLAGITRAVEVEELPGGSLGWRTRVRFAVDRRGRAGLHPHRSRRVLPVEDCLLAAPGVRALGVPGRRWAGARSVEAVAPTSMVDDATLLIEPWPGAGVRVPRDLPAGTSVLRADRAGVRVVRGSPDVHEHAMGRRFAVAAAGFWQVHPAAPDALTTAVLDGLGPVAGERAWDLYAGAGLFAAALAGAGAGVTALERDPGAAAHARANLAGLGASVRTGDVAAELGRLAPADVAVLDPPRAGAGAAVSAALAGLVGRRVVYVSCDPATLARDLATFTGAGWKLAGLRAFDLFPMTEHVECVAVLDRA
jgi:tRNA/tmRNA/rRNA uracil-C5-methylase (TrmA/RlmC/RlmD family)